MNGGIVATGAPAGQVEVTAVKKGRKSDPAEVKIDVVEHDGGVTICAVYPSTGTPNECKPGPGGRMQVRDNDVNVEFKVKLPGRQVRGPHGERRRRRDRHRRRRRGLHGERRGRGQVGRDRARGDRQRRDQGDPGPRQDWAGALKVKTVNGGIEVAVPAGLSADVKASTVNGDIETDFPLTVTGRISRRSMPGTIGSGGRQLEMETVNGGIELRKTGGKTK